jgi:hypothetical protein
MQPPVPKHESSPETLSLEPLQIVECRSIPVPPGTKASLPERNVTAVPSWPWWLLAAFTAIGGGLVGWLIAHL